MNQAGKDRIRQLLNIVRSASSYMGQTTMQPQKQWNKTHDLIRKAAGLCVPIHNSLVAEPVSPSPHVPDDTRDRFIVSESTLDQIGLIDKYADNPDLAFKGVWVLVEVIQRSPAEAYGRSYFTSQSLAERTASLLNQYGVTE